MSTFKKVDGMIDDLQKQAVGAKTLSGSAIEDFLSIAGYEDPAGGGGGGDYVTATMTLITAEDATDNFWITGLPIVDDENGCLVSTTASSDLGDGTTWNIPLYKGKLIIPSEYLVIDEYSQVLTGDIEFVDTDILITGDCTITAAGPAE